MPVDVSFSLDLGSVLSPLLVVCVAVIANQVKRAVMAHQDAQHAENAQVNQQILAQTTATNGRVTALETRQTDHEKEAKADHDLLLELKGTVGTLMGLSKGATPQ